MERNLLPVPKHLLNVYTLIAALISPYLIAGAFCHNMTHNNVQNDPAVVVWIIILLSVEIEGYLLPRRIFISYKHSDAMQLNIVKA